MDFRMLAAGAAVALLLCQAAGAQTPTQRAIPPDIRSFYPERAQREMVEGRAEISCAVTAQGGVTACSVVSETPEGYGFGDAALKMSPLFKMRPKTADGTPVEGGTVRIPLVFKLPPPDPPKKRFRLW